MSESTKLGDVIAAGVKFMALFEDLEGDHPVAFADFRAALGLAAPAPFPPAEPSEVFLPADDQARGHVELYKVSQDEIARLMKSQRELRGILAATMGAAGRLKFSDGTTVDRKIVHQPERAMKAHDYNIFYIVLRGHRS